MARSGPRMVGGGENPASLARRQANRLARFHNPALQFSATHPSVRAHLRGPPMPFLRKARLTAAAALPLALPASRAQADGTVRVGYQKHGTLILLKEKAWLEPALAKLGWRVAWAEFTGGPQLMEAFGAGALDFATTGQTPQIPAMRPGPPGSRPAST